MDYLLKHRTIFLTVVGLVALALVVGAIMSQTLMVEGQGSPPASATQPTHKAQVNFGYAFGDTYLTTLLGKHDAKIVGAYMTNEGFFGVHGAATSTDPATFIAGARAETASGFSNGAGDGTTTRARDFVGKHDAQRVTQDTEVQKRARSLIDLHARLDRARGKAQGTASLIYAVVVTGSESKLTALGAERAVIAFEIAAIDSDISWSQPSLRGGVVGQGGPPAASSSLSAGELHSRLSTLAQRDLSAE